MRTLALLFSLLLLLIPLVLTAEDKKADSVEDINACGYPCCGRNYHGHCSRCCSLAEIPDSEDQKPVKSNPVDDAKYRCGYPCCGRYYHGSCGRCCSPAEIPDTKPMSADQKVEAADQQSNQIDNEKYHGGGGHGGGGGGHGGGGGGHGGGKGGGGHGGGKGGSCLNS
ncbi:hypothetical protein ACOSQ3_002835 [Xanthoceras sorbifolium]